MNIPVNSTLGLIGLALLAIGAFMILSGLGIVSVQQVTVKKARSTWVVGIFFTLLGIFLIYPDMKLSRPSSDAEPAPQPVTTPTSISANSQSFSDETSWRSIPFQIPNDGLWLQSADNSYTATGSKDTFAWTEEVYEGDLSLSFDMDMIYGPSESGGGCIILFGDGMSWSDGTLIFCLNGVYQAIQADTVYDAVFLADSQVSLEDGGKYSFKIEILGSKASIFLDDKKIVSATLPTRINRRGQIGLYKFWAIPEVTFYNVRIKRSDY